MAESRYSLAQILEQEFNNPQTQLKCQESTHSFLKNNLGNRVFDEFPCLQTQNEFKEYCDEFKTFLSQINVSEDESPPYALNETLQENLKTFVKKILNLACIELLDEKGNIKCEIIKLFQWENFSEKLKSSEVVSAYLGATQMQIIRVYSDDIIANPIAFQGLANFINKNYRRWLRETLKDLGFGALLGDESKEDHTNFFELIRAPMKKPLVSAGLAAGALAMIYVGLNLFKAFKDKKGLNAESTTSPNIKKA